MLGEPGQKGGKGGQGGNGGQAGFGGTITIHNLNGEPIPSSGLKLGKRDQGPTRVQGASGRDGKDGKGGQHGKPGKGTGDIGFIDNVARWWNWTYKAKYFGFENDARLEIEYYENEPSEPYSRCYPHDKDKMYYAKIKYTSECVTDVETQQEKTAHGRRHKTEEVAVKKKAITLQSLSHHIEQITERQQMNQTFQMRMDSMMGQQSNRQNISQYLKDRSAIHLFSQNIEQDNEIQADIKATFVRKIDGERLQYHASSSSISRSHLPANHISHLLLNKGCDLCLSSLKSSHYQSTWEQDHIQLVPSALIHCFDQLPTLDGADNILHCILGEKESLGSYLCKSTDHNRQRLGNFIRKNGDQHSNTFSTFLKKFVLGIKRDNKDYPVANSVKNKFFAYEDDRRWRRDKTERLEIEKEIRRSENKKLWDLLAQKGTSLEEKVDYLLNPLSVNDDGGNVGTTDDVDLWNQAWSSCGQKMKETMVRINERFDWREATKSKDLMNEYANHIESPLTTLSWAELEILALAYNKKIHVYANQIMNNNVDETDAPSIRFVKTLNSRGYDEHFILYEENGTWQRLEINEKLKEFYEQRACQAVNFQRFQKNMTGQKFKMQNLNFI